MPKNISASDKTKLEKKWDDAAEARRIAIEKETMTPLQPSKVLRFELKRFGRHWNSYALDGKHMAPLLPSPSLLSSAIDALYDEMLEQAQR